MRTFKATGVVCSRGRTFDAEVQFVEDNYPDKPVYTQKLVESGFYSHDDAKAKADAAAEMVNTIIRSQVADYLNKFRDAQA